MRFRRPSSDGTRVMRPEIELPLLPIIMASVLPALAAIPALIDLPNLNAALAPVPNNPMPPMHSG